MRPQRAGLPVVAGLPASRGTGSEGSVTNTREAKELIAS